MKLGIQDLDELKACLDEGASDNGSVGVNRGLLRQMLRAPRVLIIVSGGVADYVADPGVDVEIFDWDNYNDDPKWTGKVPAHFADLAGGCPVEGEEA